MIRKTALAAAFLAALTTGASAGAIWDQSGIEPLVGGANFSEGTNRIADNFSVSGATTIRSVEIWGSHWSSGVEPAAPAFHISVHADAAGLPGALIDMSDLSVISKIDTGFDHNDNGTANILHYGLDLDAGIALGAGTYWMSVWLDEVPDTQFAWQRVQPLGPNARSSNSGATWASGAGDIAFRLNDTAIGVSEVPVPAALPLLVGALGALGVVGRRRRG